MIILSMKYQYQITYISNMQSFIEENLISSAKTRDRMLPFTPSPTFCTWEYKATLISIRLLYARKTNSHESEMEFSTRLRKRYQSIVKVLPRSKQVANFGPSQN